MASPGSTHYLPDHNAGVIVIARPILPGTQDIAIRAVRRLGIATKLLTLSKTHQS